jgi:hypothetical protein
MQNLRVNKRRSQRVKASLQVAWVRRSKRLELLSGDVSADGLFLLTDESPPLGSLMQLEVTFPDGPLLVFVCARFVGPTASGPGIGCQIYVISEADRKRWMRNYRSLLIRSDRRPAVAVAAIG